MKPLVLLHGWGMTPSVFDGLAAALPSVRAIALPGYGGAPALSTSTIETLVDDVAARAPERCCVAGWSLGGQIALEWARSRPRQVERLVLIAATPSFVTRAGWTAALERAVFETFAEGVQTDRESALRRFASLQAHGDSALKRVALRLRECVAGDASAATLQQGLHALLETDLRESLGAVAQETLVIHGDCDRLVPPAAGAFLARELPHAELLPIPGAAHAPFVSAPDAIAAALRDFLR